VSWSDTQGGGGFAARSVYRVAAIAACLLMRIIDVDSAEAMATIRLIGDVDFRYWHSVVDFPSIGRPAHAANATPYSMPRMNSFTLVTRWTGPRLT
jgi:hypothetical protein